MSRLVASVEHGLAQKIVPTRPGNRVMTRVLAVLGAAMADLSLDLGGQATLRRLARLGEQPDLNEVDVVLFDATAGDGWPVDNAVAAAAACRDHVGIVILASSQADVTVIERRAPRNTVQAVVTDRLAPGDLERLVLGMAAKVRAATGGGADS